MVTALDFITRGRVVLDVFVPGKPAPQGSKRYLGQAGGKGITVESSKAVAPWRADIREHARNACLSKRPGGITHTCYLGPIAVRLEFVMPRPKRLPKTRPTPAHTGRPDIDKLARAVLDALSSSGLWRDDAQVVDLHPTKRYAEVAETPGCSIIVEALVEAS